MTKNLASQLLCGVPVCSVTLPPCSGRRSDCSSPLQRWGSPDHLPAVTVHLAGAALLSDSTASSKKNVLQLTTRSGIQVQSHRGSS